MNPSMRTAMYAVLAAITPILVVYGLITQDQAALWLALGKAIIDMIALIIATRHVTTDDGYTPHRAAQ